MEVFSLNDNFSWTRFWCERSGIVSLGDGGYLYDPESKYFNKNVVLFETISEVPCLILLGEPGIGKTETLKNIEHLEEKLTLKIDLRSYGNENRIIKDIFENNLFKECLEGKHKLCLFLDSLDECLLRVDYLASLLIDEFKRYEDNPNLKKLLLRIVCRTADWPNLLEEGLSELWGVNNIRVMELAPLRRADVYHAAVNRGINADQFMEEIKEKDVVPFDFIINSVHVLEGQDLYETYYEGRDQKNVYVKYLQEVVASIRNTPDFDVVGHIGYLRRYSPYPDYSLAYTDHDYTDLIDEALRMLVDQGRGLDVNTSGYRTVMGRKIGSPIPGYDIIKRYIDLGGEILVLGSDAHNTETIGDGFNQACDSLRSMGIHYLTYYQNRTPVHYTI